MPDRLDIEPAVLRQLADQHDQVAAETREWAQPPSDWLANFEPTYGKIAYPVQKALEDYYGARLRAGEALAREHEQTARSLRNSADEYERSDLEGASAIGRALEDTGGGPGSGFGDPAPAPSGPAFNTPGGPETAPVGAAQNTVGTGPAVTGPGGGPVPTGGADAAGPGGTPSGGAAQPGQPGTAPQTGVTAPGSVPPGENVAASAAGTPGAGGPAGGPAGTAGVMPPGNGLVGGPLGAGSGDDRASAAPSNATPDGTPVPVAAPTPFNSAVASAKDREAEPDYIVGDTANDDLVLAKTLLGAVLAATDSPVGMTWAVAVLRGPGGAGMFITSNEGRGWLPAGLYIPRQVSTPWLWDELLAADGDVAAPWEGVADPARVLVEFGLAWGAKANATLSALVSSGPIDPGLQGRLGEVAMQGLVGPGYDVDLRVLTPDTADRLGITGSVPSLESVAAVPDAGVRARCIALALDAHAQLSRSVPGHYDTVGARGIRDRILARVEAGDEIPRSWWEELRDADDLLAAAMISQRVDVGRVDIGAIRVGDEVGALRAMVWERRCNELVALLEREPDRQVLRDAVYAHCQVLEHPAFTAVPATVAVGADERVAQPGGGTGAVSAPPVAADAPAGETPPAPPAGAVSAPNTTAGPPPAVVPPVVAPPATDREAQ
ncbi:type VII secretion target [Nocardia sp. NPDC024068]|uniref:type VII secretion target n=1 Tax=Nocardia sp. NPDC024068 TaxID=3157197 RepID=UPI0033D776C0